MLTATAISKAQGSKQLFRDVSFQLSDRRRIALIGSNGVGKTTLIEILLGIRILTKGMFNGRRQGSIGYLQTLQDELVGTALEATLEGASHITDLEERLSELREVLKSRKAPIKIIY